MEAATLVDSDDVHLLTESEERLDGMAGCIEGVCRGRMLKVNVSKSKVSVFRKWAFTVYCLYEWRRI